MSGCCDPCGDPGPGAGPATPRDAANPPGAPAVTHRAGRAADHLRSMRWSLANDPRAAGLSLDSGDDWSLALCDAAAGLLDAVGFVTTRIANEHYLRTAAEPRSLGWLAALVGHQPTPGVAGEAALAFTVEAPPGAGGADAEITVPPGAPVRSTPGPGEDAQLFETVEPLAARAAWNAMPAVLSEPWSPAAGDTDLWVAGVSTALKPGDALLILGAERLAGPSPRWALRVLSAVEPDPAGGRTRAAWTQPLAANDIPADRAEVHVLRQRAARFGAAAPNPGMFLSPPKPNEPDWTFPASETVLDLDSELPAVTPGGWAALVAGAATSVVKVTAAASVARAQYGLSAKVTRITPDVPAIAASFFPVRGTAVLCASERLVPAPRPIPAPFGGGALRIEHGSTLPAGRALAVSGRLQRIAPLTALTVMPDDGPPRPLKPGETARLADAPLRADGSTLPPEALHAAPAARARLLLDDGAAGWATLPQGGWALAPSRTGDPEVAALASVARATADLVEVTPFVRLPLDRATARVCANVARATAGESVAEVLGSSTGRADQGFALRQGPLAFVPAEGADGRASTLEVRVNGVRWREVPSLFGQPPDARVFETVTDAAGRTLVRFGDGAEGAIPPPGQENIRALYRRAPTAPAAVRAGALSTLAARPAGVKSAVNPLPAGKGAAPQGMAALRTAAPRATRTLGRAVSTEDYADIARGFGIAKVRADWIAAGPGRGVLLTLADDDGNGIDPSAALASRLSASFRQIGDPHLPVRLAAARPLRFRVRAAVRLDPDADPATLGLLRAALKARFGPAARDFGGAVTADAVAAALVAASPAVLGATVLALHAGGAPSLQPRLFASLPVASLAAVPLGAELLILDGDPALEAA